MTDTIEPTRIHGRYLLQERIALGGSAEVWRARDEELDRPVAVKLLHPHLVPNETARRRLAEEGRMAASLSHPAIVKVYEVQAEGETPALVMELIEGESLNVKLARDGPLTPTVAASIGADLADALAEAHRNGIIHRDVKPSNILIDQDGHAHLADFGIAHSLAPAAERLTLTGTVVGTLAYLSPEQLAGDKVGPRSDLYGLGVVLFEMLTGRPPFVATSLLALAEEQLAGPPRLPDVDPTLADITRACLSARPADRPPGASFVAAILRAASMRPAGRDDETRAIPVLAPAAPPGEPRGRRVPLLAFGATGALVVLLLVLAMLGPGKPVEGAPASRASSTPTPEWMVQLFSDYRAACGEGLDPGTIAGLSQADAEDRVATLIEDCGATQSDGGGGGSGKGKGHGKP
jgi:eukaryotic-like serine/threonine-protein kinase